MIKQRTSKLIYLLGLAAWLCTPTIGQAKHPKNEVAFYIELYGELTPEQNPYAAHAHRIYAKVRAVADINNNRIPNLVVVNSDSDPWAIALPDGHIVLSKKSIETCQHYKPAPNACLAFVLGHELAHLSNDDFWHREVYSFLSSRPTERSRAQFIEQNSHAREREFVADDQGFIYAAMAGYDVDKLLRQHATDPSFFSNWIAQTSTLLETSHPHALDRTELLRKRLEGIVDKLGLFNFGIRLSHFDYCDDAVYFFREFQKTFPSREVLNNLGYCHLQLARQQMENQRANFYWLPYVLDGETRASGYSSRAEHAITSLRLAAQNQPAGHLKDAEEYLLRAANADEQYVPARVNLAIVYLYLGKPHKARATLGEALELPLSDQERRILSGLDAVIRYEQGDEYFDSWPSAIQKLQRLVKAEQAPPSLIFNLARLLETREQHQAAAPYWASLTNFANSLPDPIFAMTCSLNSSDATTNCPSKQTAQHQQLPWQWPFPVQSLKKVSSATLSKHLSSWAQTPIDWYTDKLHGNIYQQRNGQADILVLDQFVQMQVNRNIATIDITKLPEYCPVLMKKRTIAQGEIWTCDHWAVWITDGIAREAWWIAKLQ